MKIFTLLAVLTVTVALNAQDAIDFDNVGQDYEWVVFDQDDLENSFQVVDNTDFMGINTTTKVGQHISEAGKVPWSGVKTGSMGPITFSEENSCVSVMVSKSSQVNFGLKFEDGDIGAVEIKKMVSVTDQWELLLFDFSALDGGTFNTMVIFPDFTEENPRSEGHTTYFDEITFNNASVCAEPSTSVKMDDKASLKVYPNPASGYITVEANDIQSLEIINVVGKQVKVVDNINNDRASLSVSELTGGVYFAVVKSTNGKKSMMKFTKE